MHCRSSIELLMCCIEDVHRHNVCILYHQSVIFALILPLLHVTGMQVAEVQTSDGLKIAGMIRAGIKKVLGCGNGDAHLAQQNEAIANAGVANAEAFLPVAYILGLRVAPDYRRLGIGAALVLKMEAWCKKNGAMYTYIATEKDNEASVKLFTEKLGYSKFRTPAILVQPVYASYKKAKSGVKIVELPVDKAEALYRDIFRDREFFPSDVDAIIKSKLHRGTWIAVWKDEVKHVKGEKKQVVSITDSDSSDEEESPIALSSSWAVLSIWKCHEIFKLQVKGAPLHTRLAVTAARLLGKLLRKLGTIPTPPNVFKPFGLELLYGLHCHGDRGGELVSELCWFAHNLAKKEGCAVLATEMGSCDPMRSWVPHWQSLSCDEDLWCIKHLCPSSTPEEGKDWCSSASPSSLFVDPRDF
ncbi:hypothetical protein KP509_21G055400 [Ceratopteris richardii]|uniref:N-acetyltransferase domain-containing protein n=1 Tax=Ceratopteris richardii TaxID=49495 RepID=A0A8T2SA48_CERRI|nr:hypothetical protein KP509_21G055400 [Ceratopteris richardii]